MITARASQQSEAQAAVPAGRAVDMRRNHNRDSDTTEVIREATMEEAIESALARPEGHIWVDGRSCYVSF